jgi:hypothetical protein
MLEGLNALLAADGLRSAMCWEVLVSSWGVEETAE